MKKILKLLLGVIAAIILLLVVATMALPLIYDVEDLEATIAGQVYEQTGRELKIDGELNFSVFPWLAVEVSDVSLGNAKAFGDGQFAQISHARVGVALMPLLRKQIAVDEITLDGLELALVVNRDGISNWEDLAADEDEGIDEDGSEAVSARRVAGLNIRNAIVDFDDQQAGSHYTLSELSMQTGALGDGIPVPIEFAALFADVKAGTRLKLDMGATVAMDMIADRYAFENFALDLTLNPGSQGKGSQTVQIETPLMNLDLAEQTLLMNGFKAKLADFKVDGTLSARNILEDPSFKGTLNTDEFSPRSLMASLDLDPPDTSDPTALQSARFSTSFEGNAASLELTALELKLDQSRLSGEVALRDAGQVSMGFDLAVDEINLDRYMAPAEEGGTDDVAMPRDELRNQEVRGNLKIGRLQMAGLEFLDADVGVAISNGALRLHPLTAGFYGGTYSGNVSIDGSGPTPRLSLDENIDSITFQRLVSDLVDSDALSGTAQGRVRLSGSGATSNEVLRSLNGEVGLSLAEGALEGINIWYEIRRGLAMYKGLQAPPKEPARTVFSRLQLDGSIADGVFSTRNLKGELPFLTLSGTGEVDLGASLLDLGLVAVVNSSPELAADPLGSEISGKRLPFRLTGSLNDPSVKVDWAELLKDEATKMLLDKLNLGGRKDSKSDREDAGAGDDAADGGEDERSNEDALEEAAKGALFDLLKGKDKDEGRQEDEE
jgi:AsmA protein